MVIKLSMYVGMDVNLAFWREVKMTAACNFISLGEKLRELLDKNGKKKKKWEENKRGEELIIWLDKEGAEICALSFLAKLNESWQSWFKVSTARRAVNEGAQFSENVCSNHLWNMI